MGWPRGAAPGHGRADWWHGWNVDFKHEQTVNLLACVGQEGVEFGLARKPWAQPFGERGTHPHLHGACCLLAAAAGSRTLKRQHRWRKIMVNWGKRAVE